eukprot:57392_1
MASCNIYFALILLSSCMISIILASDSIPSLLRYPQFDGTDINIFQCHSNSKEGSFTFDSGRGKAYFALSDTMLYMEYYAPMLYWTGLTSSDQSVNGVHHDCAQCLEQHNHRSSECTTHCVIDHIFIVTGQSEDANKWISLELQINDALALPNIKNPSELHGESMSKVDVCEHGINAPCHHYVHVKYYRDYTNRNGDSFDLFNDDPRACFSWIVSDPSEGAFVTAVKASTVFNYGVVCAEVKAHNACVTRASQPIEEPHTTPSNTEPIAPSHEFIIPENACKQNDLSVVFVMDLSDSISAHAMDMGKQWIQNTIDIGTQLLSQHDLHFRSSLVTFSSKNELVWNLGEDAEIIRDKLTHLQRPHDPLLEEGVTFTKDALQRVIDGVLPFSNTGEQLLVVIVTDGLPSNVYQNPCNVESDISAELHSAAVRTVVVAIEQGAVFDTSPFECLYYPYATENSFISVESYESLLGYQMNPIIIDCAFPIHCDVNYDVTIPSDLYHKVDAVVDQSHTQSVEEDNEVMMDAGDDDESSVGYNHDTCDPSEPYVPIRTFVYQDEDKTYEKCGESTTEWRLELLDWQYHKHRDKTEYIYSICTSHLKPFDHCKGYETAEDEASQSLKSIALQMPCDCEVCIGYSVHRMEPQGRFAQLEKAWIWGDLEVGAGQCQTLTMTLMGYAEAVSGNYFLEGKDKYEEGKIAVPNPCNGDLDHQLYPMPHVPSRDSYPNPKAAQCHDEESMDPYYPSYCKGFCHPKQMEYDIKFVERKYSKGSDKTTFTYSLSTLKPVHLPKDFCSYYPFGLAIPLKELHLSVPCECQHMIQNGNTLFSLTDGMMPYNEKDGVSEFFWHFTELDVKVGQTKNITIVMNGMIPFGMGDYTVVGDMNRCGYGRHVIRVPDICNNRCLWGQWTPWDTQWHSCSKKCGGGITKRSRKCVSVCDGKTPVFNCYGEAEETTPCNTNECGKYKHYPESITSAAKYWSASQK